MWRERAIRWGWWIVAMNALISIMNMGFAYGHFTKHEIWAGIVSSLLVIMNGWVAYWQWTSIRKYRQELKELMWTTLSTPAGELR